MESGLFVPMVLILDIYTFQKTEMFLKNKIAFFVFACIATYIRGKKIFRGIALKMSCPEEQLSIV